MGAWEFNTAAWGRTPSEAFAAARDRAAHEHGHGGYTGTIAEKHDFALLELPPRTKVEKVIGLIREAAGLNEVIYLREELAYLEASLPRVASAEKPALRRRIAEAKRAVAKADKAAERFRRKAGPLLPLVERALPIYDDKWGAAVAFEVKSAPELASYSRYAPKPKRGYKLYAFAGYASS